MTSTLFKACNSLLKSSSKSSTLINWTPQAFGSMWRFNWYTSPDGAWPNYKPHLHHHKHQRHRTKPFSEGLHKHSLVRVVDNSEIGMEAMSLGRPPKVIHIYSKRHLSRPHGAYGVLGDLVLLAILGEKRKAVIVGLKCKQPHGIPRYDTNNVVLINDDGSPIGTEFFAPIPFHLKDKLKSMTHYKKPDYTKVLDVAASSRGFI